jgi:hypothetical protein
VTRTQCPVCGADSRFTHICKSGSLLRPEDITPAAIVAAQLRAELARVTAERDSARSSWEDVLHAHASRGMRINSLGRELSEARAALEKAVACIEMNRKGWGADWRELDQTRSDHADTELARQVAQSELDQTRKAWAARELELRRRLPMHWLHELDDSCEPVAALIRAHAGQPVGTCDRCGQVAPLRDAGTVRTDPSGTVRVCAWADGCAEKEAGK